MNDIEETGGAKIGLAHATWPFAKLTVNKNVLQLNASVIGNLYFRPSDIISIEPSSFLSGAGIRINHRVEKYSSKVIFLTSGSSDLISRIESTGFLHNTDALPVDVEAEITKYQLGGSFPIKWSAAIAFIVIWNLLFLADQLGYFGKKSNMPLGNGARLAIASAFLFALALLISEPFRQLVLKEGRTTKDVKPFLLFLMLITGIMLLALSAIPN
ncbi:MAG: hypothetical protein JWR09_68 [Mucilaginibacter sp.]|nr:hypothetical protein [Mucilaginibacter sp.]